MSALKTFASRILGIFWIIVGVLLAFAGLAVLVSWPVASVAFAIVLGKAALIALGVL